MCRLCRRWSADRTAGCSTRLCGWRDGSPACRRIDCRPYEGRAQQQLREHGWQEGGTVKHPVVGIDLGTTYSAVAAWDVDRGDAVVIFDETGRPTPSVVGLDPVTHLVIVGEVAKNNGPADPANTIVEIKREMGELFTAETLAKYKYELTELEKKEKAEKGVVPPVRVLFDHEWMLPQEISAFTLMRMKAIAERQMGQEVRDAVVTVPAYFTANQKKATEQAALLAGLYPQQLIPEPTAAAICYGVDRSEDKRQVFLVYDLGGG